MHKSSVESKCELGAELSDLITHNFIDSLSE